MAIKLRSALKDLKPQSASVKLFLEATIFGLTLFVAASHQFGFFWLLLVLGVAAGFYFEGLVRILAFFFTFSGLLLVSIAVLNFFYIAPLPIFFLSVLFGILFYLLLGIQRVHFVFRARWHFTLVLILFYFSSLIFFASQFAHNFILKSLLLFFFFATVLYEFFSTTIGGGVRKLTALSALFAYILIEALWGISLLPIGAFSSAALLLALLYFTADSMYHYLHHSLTSQRLRNNIIGVTSVAAIILGFAHWGP